jgi:hypothetical protein
LGGWGGPDTGSLAWASCLLTLAGPGRRAGGARGHGSQAGELAQGATESAGRALSSLHSAGEAAVGGGLDIAVTIVQKAGGVAVDGVEAVASGVGDALGGAGEALGEVLGSVIEGAGEVVGDVLVGAVLGALEGVTGE